MLPVLGPVNIFIRPLGEFPTFNQSAGCKRRDHGDDHFLYEGCLHLNNIRAGAVPRKSPKAPLVGDYDIRAQQGIGDCVGENAGGEAAGAAGYEII